MLQDIVLKGATSRSVTVKIVDNTTGLPVTSVVFNTSGIDLWYRREGAVRTAITEATLAALTTAWASGGFLHVSDGVYRLDLPDAAFATGANYVDFGGTVTGFVVIGGRVRLIDVNLEDAVRGGMTALPNAAAAATGGLPTVDAANSVKIQTVNKKNTALANFEFNMWLTGTNTPATGKTVTVTRAIDGGAYAAGTLGTVSEIANGTYKVDLAAGDRNGNSIVLQATATGCDPTFERFMMEP